MGELLRSRHRQQGVPGNRQLHGCAVTPVVALQAQGQATQGRDLSTPASLRALWARTPVPAWARRAVGEGVRSCPSAGCGRSARPVRRAATGNGALAWIEAPVATGQPLLPIPRLPRQSSTLPWLCEDAAAASLTDLDCSAA